MNTSIPSRKSRTPDPANVEEAGARSSRDTLYWLAFDVRVRDLRGTRPNAVVLAEYLSLGDLIVPGVGPALSDADALRPRELTPAEIRGIPCLAEVPRAVPRGRRLVVLTWPDQTAVILTVARSQKQFASWWLLFTYNASRKASALAEFTPAGNPDSESPDDTRDWKAKLAMIVNAGALATGSK